MVNLKTIPDAAYIRDMGDKVAMGALTTLADVEKSDAFTGELKAVAEAAHSVATPIIRNSATVGGNLCQDVRCWYYRYPDAVGGKLLCARKGGDECYAIQGRNQYHSIMGGMHTGHNACSTECPAGTDIPAYMEKIRANDWDGAAEIILRVNPMPMLTARVCPHTCQTKCNQCQHGDSVSIHSVERALGDYILAHADKFYPAPAQETGKKVSIVGGGPAGLTAAYYLRKAGHSVTIYEKMEEAGGVMMYGIPEYVCPSTMCVTWSGDRRDGRGHQEQHRGWQGHHPGGDQVRQRHRLPGYRRLETADPGHRRREPDPVRPELLVEVKKFMTKQIGKEVLVCGGGNVAMDVALTAVRLGAQKVKLVCLEQRDEMPASAEEIARAEEEGVEIFNGWGLKKVITGADGKITGLESMKCLSVRDESGRFNPSYGEETRVFSSDCIILATGQKVDIDFLGEKYREELKSARGLIEVGEHRDTRAPGIYAGGDAAYGPSVAIKAIRDGGIAARSMSRYMGFEPEVPARDKGFTKFDAERIYITKGAVEKDTPVAERCLDKEDSTSLTMEEARAEAGRCMNCGCYSVNASDMATVMVALDAEIHTTEQTFKAADFFSVMHSVDQLKPGELVTEIQVPKMPGYRTGYLKMRLREAIDFAVTALAYAYKEEDGVIVDARLVAGGIAPVPVRLTAAEQVLIGKKKSAELAQEAFAAAMKDAQP